MAQLLVAYGRRFAGSVVLGCLAAWRVSFCRELRQRANVGGVVSLSCFKSEGKSATVPVAPPQPVLVVSEVAQCSVEVRQILAIVIVAACWVPSPDSELCSEGGVADGFTGAGLAVMLFQPPKILWLCPLAGAFDDFAQSLYFSTECMLGWGFELRYVGEGGDGESAVGGGVVAQACALGFPQLAALEELFSWAFP